MVEIIESLNTNENTTLNMTKEILIKLATLDIKDNTEEIDMEILKKAQRNIEKLMSDFKRKCSGCKKEYSFQEEFKYINTYLCRSCLREFQSKRYERLKNEVITCECGQTVKKYSLSAHKKTKKHELELKCKKLLNN